MRYSESDHALMLCCAHLPGATGPRPLATAEWDALARYLMAARKTPADLLDAAFVASWPDAIELEKKRHSNDPESPHRGAPFSGPRARGRACGLGGTRHLGGNPRIEPLSGRGLTDPGAKQSSALLCSGQPRTPAGRRRRHRRFARCGARSARLGRSLRGRGRPSGCYGRFGLRARDRPRGDVGGALRGR